MHAEQSLDTLQERFEKLVLLRDTDSLSSMHRRGIANRFDKISLQELLRIANELNNPRA